MRVVIINADVGIEVNVLVEILKNSGGGETEGETLSRNALCNRGKIPDGGGTGSKRVGV